jgi:DNA excision repair protein ERCC-6-like 2
MTTLSRYSSPGEFANVEEVLLCLLSLLISILFRTKDASKEVIELGASTALALSTKLQQVYLRRTKEDVLADFLPKKDERIIFCELSTLQKELYQYIIEQPDFVILRHKNAPCDCGVNMKVCHFVNVFGKETVLSSPTF